MKGQVAEINYQRGMVAVLTEDGDYTILEMLEEGIKVGDILEWPTHNPLGRETIHNLTKEIRVEVYFQNHWVNKDQLQQQLLY